MECPNCGTENRAGARFCAKCGNRLPEAEPVTDVLPAVSEEEPAAEPGGSGRAADVPSEPASEPIEETPAAETKSEVAGIDSSATEAVPEEAEPVNDDAEEGTATGEEVAELEPLPAGTLLADRYEVVEAVSNDVEGNVYVALDLARCALCGFDENAPADEFCADCGAALDAPPKCEVREQPERAEPEAVARFVADGRRYAVIVQEAAGEPESTETTPPQIQLRWAAETHPGQVRELNEDHVDVHVYSAQAGPTMGLFVVADGVGGQAAGEVASQLATHVIWEGVRETVWLAELQGEPVLPETIETRMGEAVQAANQAVYQQRTEQANDMGTTVTLALVRDTVAVIANVGDSRAYRWNAGGLQQLTVDHSLVQSLIDAGEVEPEAIYTHPQRNVIYRAVGDRPKIEVDTFVEELSPGDRLILCSDGLWEMVRDDGIEEILLREPDPQAACDALVERANLAGGTDNISVVIANLAV